MKQVISIMRFLVVFGLLILTPALQGGAAEGETGYDRAKSFFKEGIYDVYYEVSAFEVDALMNVRVIGTTVIEGVAFLVIGGGDLSIKDREGYILLNSVRAILPAGSPKPQRTFDIKRQ